MMIIIAMMTMMATTSKKLKTDVMSQKGFRKRAYSYSIPSLVNESKLKANLVVRALHTNLTLCVWVNRAKNVFAANAQVTGYSKGTLKKHYTNQYFFIHAWYL